MTHLHALGDPLRILEPLIDPVWTQVAARSEGRAHTRVLFTSPSNKAGTSLLSVATAAALARNLRTQVLHVETHLRQPGVAEFAGVEGSPGFSDLLLGHAGMEEVTREVPGTPGLFVVPGGTPRAAIPGEFAARTAQELFRGFAKLSRFVVFDAPPLTDYLEARSLLAFADAAVVVLRSRDSSRAKAAELVRIVEGAGVPLLGCVLNRHVAEVGFLER